MRAPCYNSVNSLEEKDGLRRKLALVAFLFSFFFRSFLAKKMVRSKPRSKKDYKKETVRRKKAPQTTPESRRRRAVVKRRRKALPLIQKQRETAVEYACKLFREAIGGKRSVRHYPKKKSYKKKAPPVRVLRPPTFDKLRKLFPPGHIKKPIRVGDSVVFVFPTATPVKAWLHGVVDCIIPHKADSNWVVIRWPKVSSKNRNPFIAIDSPNVYQAPETHNEFPICLPDVKWPTRGVYVLHCPHLNQFYP